MSWSINLIGKKAAIKKKVAEEPCLPESVKTVIIEHIQEDNLGTLNGVRVEGYGHKSDGPGSYHSGIGKLEVVQIQIQED
jgi:hypothetical protein